MQDLPTDLAEARDALEACDRNGEALATSLSEAQFHWRPRDGAGWSAAQCLHHLALANRAYVGAMDAALQEAAARGWRRSGPIASTVFGRLFVHVLEPPVRQRVKAHASIVPADVPPRADVLRAFHAAHADLIALIGRAAELDVNRATFVSPFARGIRVRVGTAFRIVAAHDRRHLWQAERVREAPGFPADQRADQSGFTRA